MDWVGSDLQEHLMSPVLRVAFVKSWLGGKSGGATCLQMHELDGHFWTNQPEKAVRHFRYSYGRVPLLYWTDAGLHPLIKYVQGWGNSPDREKDIWIRWIERHKFSSSALDCTYYRWDWKQTAAVSSGRVSGQHRRRRGTINCATLSHTKWQTSDTSRDWKRY